MTTDIYVLGAGSIGCLFSYYLKKYNNNVTLIIRNKKDNQVSIDNVQKPLSVEFKYKSSEGKPIDTDTIQCIVKTPTQIKLNKEEIKILLITTKSPDTLQAIQSIESSLHSECVIILMQNGVLGTYSLLTEYFLKKHQQDKIKLPRILTGTTSNGSYRISSLNIVHAGKGTTFIGEPQGEYTQLYNEQHSNSNIDFLQIINKQFSPLNELDVTVYTEPQDYTTKLLPLLQTKLIVNACLNPLTALFECLNGWIVDSIQVENQTLKNMDRQKHPCNTMIKEICQEAAWVLVEEEDENNYNKIKTNQILDLPISSHHLSEKAKRQAELWEINVIDVGKKTYLNRNSMLQDIDAKRAVTEIEFLNGYLVKEAHKKYQRLIQNSYNDSNINSSNNNNNNKTILDITEILYLISFFLFFFSKKKTKIKMSQSFDDNVPLISLINDNDSTDSSLNETQEFIGLKSFSKKNKNNYSTSNSNKGRTILIGKESRTKYSQNVIKNQKYNIITFLPVVLYEQFKFFLNLYFLLVALSQFIPAIKIGYLVTYVGPLVFILSITISKEAYDDLLRKKRDNEENSRKYEILTPDGFKQIPSSKIKVGHLVRIHENQRVPADLLLLKTSNINGECFIRTDQLDGETDWKLRTAVSTTQQLEFDSELYDYQASVYAEDPHKDIYKFIGTFTSFSSSEDSINTPLNVENTIWANTVLASGTAIGLVLYTGRDTRSVMNTSFPKTKVGKIDWEINRLAKILCVIAFTVSIVLIILNNFRGIWYVSLIRFIIIFSSIIPISLRVNLDLGKTYYSYDIMHDNRIPGTIVRTSTIPEELGRVEYILTDKTGTLTKNEMELKQIHLGTLSYTTEAMEEIKSNLLMLYENKNEINNIRFKRSKDIVNRIKDIVLALALCHNVTPIISEDGKLTYEASSPDEIAIVKWTEDIGMTLIYRDTKKIKLRTPIDTILEFTILEIFPFTSETKRMGIIVKDEATNEITFYMKGADVVLSKMVLYNDWLDEECGNMARKGLRTLVIAKKKLSLNSYMEFQTKYDQAKLSVADRNGDMEKVQNSIENDLELLGLTGVEDKLQDNVKSTLELLRNAGIKIWMLTGDKVETASCIAVSSKLVSRNSSIIQFCKIHDLVELKEKLVGLNSLTDACLVIDGETLQLCLSSCKDLFYETTKNLPAVVCCRCSPTQKADVTKLIKSKIKNCVCAIGDGGNDVSMIQSADVGIGIVGKEGKQASLAADFSINQFQYLASLLLWHGRNSYKRSAALSQFIIHRGIIIAVIQVVFSVMFYFAPIALYQGLLLVGYSTVFTSGPVFSLVLDKDINYATAMKYPELYKELSKGRSLSFKTFFQWMLISVYQGGIIMTGSILLFEDQFQNIKSITFTALIFNELLMVAFEVKTWHKMMVLAEIVTLFFYISSMFYLKTDFDLSFIFSIVFVWKVAVITLVTSFPLYIIKIIKRYFSPPKYLLIRDE